jgi:hypothetical protein
MKKILGSVALALLIAVSALASMGSAACGPECCEDVPSCTPACCAE